MVSFIIFCIGAYLVIVIGSVIILSLAAALSMFSTAIGETGLPKLIERHILSILFAALLTTIAISAVVL